MLESIVEVVAVHAKNEPDKLCVVDENGTYTYAAMWTQVRMTAQKLEVLWHINKGDCVMVECMQNADFLICGLACELLGAIFVPVEHRASEERVKKILEETDAGIFICDTEYHVSVNRVPATKLFLEKAEVTAEYPLPKAEDTAEILYTTGTTGASKGIEITNGSNIALAENVKYGTEMRQNNVELIPLPLSHSHGLRCCYANMLNGSTVVLIEGVSRVKKVFELIENYGVTSMDVSPSAVQVLSKLSKGKLAEISSQIDYIQVGTAALQEDVKEILISNFPAARLYNFYGSTESGRTCVLDFNKERNRKGCIGRPTKNARFIVTNDNREQIESSIDHMGLLASAGPMNMKGYWRQPELTAQTMQDGFVYTNDLGYVDADGYIYVLGRKDDIINYKGIKIAPEEIEECARRYEGITDCACVPREEKISGQVPVLFVVVGDKEKFQKKELFLFLERFIDPNKMPKEIEIIDEIPRTYNGKIHRIKLIDRNWEK